MNKIHYDYLTRKGDELESRFFTVKDFIKVLKHSFMTFEDYGIAVHNKVDPIYRDQYKFNFTQFHMAKHFPYQAAAEMRKIISNSSDDGMIPEVNLFGTKILNFNQHGKPMFDFYVNKTTPLFFDTCDTGDEITTYDRSDLEAGILFIRILNYRNEGKTIEWTDINTRINVNYGLIDSQMRAMPWFIDQYLNVYTSKHILEDEIYVMSPLLHHSLKVFDKLLILSKQRVGFIRPNLLRNAIDASFNDARIIQGMNDKYKMINNCFVRIVPTLMRTKFGLPDEVSRFFDFVNQQNQTNVFSYADVVTNGSGNTSSNKINLDDYVRAVRNLRLYDIPFTKEENTNNGLFSWLNPAFVNVLNLYNKEFCFTDKEMDSSVLNDHMISIDHENQQYETAINGSTDLTKVIDKKKQDDLIKKYNQRSKHAFSRTFLFDDNDVDPELSDLSKIDDFRSKKKSFILKEVGNDHFFLRNVNYLNNSKKLEETSYSRNALVAFVSNNVDLHPVDEIVTMEIDDINRWFKSLRGVACEGFFSRDFLRQRMVVHRTKRLKMALEDTSEEFQALVRDPSSKLLKIIPNHDKKEFFVRSYYTCACEGKIVNDKCRTCGDPRPVSSVAGIDSWVDFDKGFDFAKMTGIEVVEDGINVFLEYLIPLVNSRFKCEELTKTVAVETAQGDLGYITRLCLQDIEINDVRIPLDGVYFGLGGFKSKTHGIPFTVLRLYNALSGYIKFSSEDCLRNTDLVNEFLSKFKKSTIITKMFDSLKGIYVDRVVEAWVGLVAISPTEVSQEFNKSRFEDERSFGKTNYALNNLLGFDDLNKALSNESNLHNNQSTEYRNELFKIAKIHSSFRPVVPITSKAKAKAARHDKLLAGLYNITPSYSQKDNVFDLRSVDKYGLRDFLTYEEYENLIKTYPLFTNKQFVKGFYINCSLTPDDKQTPFYKGYGAIEYTLYFPKRDILMAMFEMIGDNNVRINGLLSSYISIFETLAVSRLGDPGFGDNPSKNQLINKTNNKTHSLNNINGKILNEANDLLFDKEGILNQITNIAIPRFMSKQLTSIDCPYDVAIIANNIQYKKIVSKIFDSLYPDEKQDWTTPERDRKGDFVIDENGDEKKGGWCWYKDVYGTAIREPNLFSKQNLNIKQLWSSYKADVEFKAKIGITFMQKHPGTKGIYLNPVFVAFNLEGDVDGDTIFVSAPFTIACQQELFKVYDRIKDMKFFDKNNTDPVAQLVRETYLVPSMNYLLDEAENLNFTLDTLKIGYSKIDFVNSIKANFEASRNKENIGFLTVSLWYVTYFLDFYMFNYETLLEKKYVVPELTSQDKYELLFIFQYLLAQQNGVRAMKGDGSYGKITLDSLVINKPLEEGDEPPQDLLAKLVDEYTADLAKRNIAVNLKPALKKFYTILNNLFISTGKNKGFGYAIGVEGNVFSYRNDEWTYGPIDPAKQKKKIMTYDCTDKYDPFFVDFYACFLLINGRNTKIFVDKFGYDKTLEALDFEHKSHLGSSLLSYSESVLIA